MLTLLHALQDLQIQTEASTNRLQDVRRRDPSNPALFYDIWKFMRGWPQFPWFQDLAKLFWLKGLNTDLSYRRPMGLPFDWTQVRSTPAHVLHFPVMVSPHDIQYYNAKWSQNDPQVMTLLSPTFPIFSLNFLFLNFPSLNFPNYIYKFFCNLVCQTHFHLFCSSNFFHFSQPASV